MSRPCNASCHTDDGVDMKTKRCPNCGAELPVELHFCLYCMHELPAEGTNSLPRKPKRSRWRIGFLAVSAAVLLALAWMLPFLKEHAKQIPSPAPSEAPNPTYKPQLVDAMNADLFKGEAGLKNLNEWAKSFGVENTFSIVPLTTVDYFFLATCDIELLKGTYMRFDFHPALTNFRCITYDLSGEQETEFFQFCSFLAGIFGGSQERDTILSFLSDDDGYKPSPASETYNEQDGVNGHHFIPVALEKLDELMYETEVNPDGLLSKTLDTSIAHYVLEINESGRTEKAKDYVFVAVKK